MYRNYLLILFFSISFLSESLVAESQDFNYTLSDDSLVNHHASIKRVYYATRTNLKPKVDGKLDDECWKVVGKWDGGFIQQQPHQANAPSQQTEIKILYDDTYLYFAIVCHDDEPDKISPILGRRDENNGDMAGIALDSYNDKQTAFEFNVTAAGQKVDLMHLGEYGWDFNWDAVWDGKSSVGDSAWYAEMRVPFTQLRFANNEEHVWGMHIWRWIHRLSEEDQWKLIPVDAPAMVYIFGELRGIKDIPFKRNFEVLPYVKSKYISDAHDKFNFGGGLDGKIAVTSDFTLDYTINPDFGQVEADPSVLNLTSYEVFYDEKRPFFLEGNNILEYGAGSDLLFYSRRIGHAPSYAPGYTEGINSISVPDNTSIINALKLTGKNKKGLSLGIINSMTANEQATLFSNNGSSKEAVEPFTNYFIGRVKKDFNKGNTVLGGLVTSTIRNIKDDHLDFLADNSTVGGVDFEHNWKNRKYFVNFKSFYSQVNGSTTAISSLQNNSRHYFQRPDAGHLKYDPELTTLEGWGGEISGGKRSGKVRLTGGFDWRSPGVELNDLGYLRQADYIDQNLDFLYWINKPKGILRSYHIGVEQMHHWSYGGENIGDEININSRIQFKNRWRLDLVFDRKFNTIDTRQLWGGPSLRIDNRTMGRVNLQTDPGKDVILGFSGYWARFDDKISQENYSQFYIQWLISNRFTVAARTTYTNEVDNSQYVMQKSITDN
ncbi:DUF5916 domain-containing protein [Maribellus maritimus]|uniref:DUF5916 domain-containing protein n=1 Tax=Maribellus maritimus TaxID=2870838 RepID=UPI001EEB5E98|nr:DUF5916 domain-containing protein [Maribellus maritimus]MCG6187615.1 carbohydrate binding family 9 domain-containing protein [Maribellus maritimus]